MSELANMPPWSRWIVSGVIGIVVVAYTAYGGLRVSIHTDRIQFWVLMPVLLLVIVVAAALIGGRGIWSAAGDTGLLGVTSSGSYFFAIVWACAVQRSLLRLVLGGLQSTFHVCGRYS